MKKFLLFIIITAIYITPVFADENGDLWNSYDIKDTPQKETKFVSDEDFEKALNQKNSKVNRWKNWLQKTNVPRGKEFSQSNETEIINSNQGEDASLPVISLPVELTISDCVIPVGHYQVKGEMIDGKPILNFYQASNLILKLPAIETQDDFDKDEILFVDWVEIDENKLKIIYGSLDFNAYTFVDYIK